MKWVWLLIPLMGLELAICPPDAFAAEVEVRECVEMEDSQESQDDVRKSASSDGIACASIYDVTFCPVVSNVRSADVASGGIRAPPSF